MRLRTPSKNDLVTHFGLSLKERSQNISVAKDPPGHPVQSSHFIEETEVQAEEVICLWLRSLLANGL